MNGKTNQLMAFHIYKLITAYIHFYEWNETNPMHSGWYLDAFNEWGQTSKFSSSALTCHIFSSKTEKFEIHSY